MKKIIMLALVLITVATTAFSLDPINVNNLVLQSFNKEFKKAVNIEWAVNKDFVRAKFTMDEQIMYAYFTENGELMAVTRNITVEQLPVNLAAKLKSKYSDHYLADLFEVSKDGETTYYATVSDAKCSIILQSVSNDDWHQYKKQKL
jgi:hypothetical protein